jgi:hypothetical protein
MVSSYLNDLLRMQKGEPWEAIPFAWCAKNVALVDGDVIEKRQGWITAKQEGAEFARLLPVLQ